MKKKTENIPKKTIKKSTTKPVQKDKEAPVVRKKTTSKWKEMSPMQEKAVKILAKKVEKTWKVVLWEVLQEAWYSKKTAINPQQVFWKPPVLRALKRMKLTPEDMRQKHEDLFNMESVEVFRYSLNVPPEDIIHLIEWRIKWSKCAKHFVLPDQWIRVYEFVMPNIGMQKAMLELAYKVFPPKPTTEDPKVMQKTKEKQNSVLEESKARLMLQKKLKLWISTS